MDWSGNALQFYLGDYLGDTYGYPGIKFPPPMLLVEIGCCDPDKAFLQDLRPVGPTEDPGSSNRLLLHVKEDENSLLYDMCVQASSIISSNIYRDGDKPLYRRGNKILLGILAYNVVLIVVLILGTKYYYVRKNSNREIKWQGMTDQDRQDYLKTTKDKGNKRLDFRFAH